MPTPAPDRAPLVRTLPAYLHPHLARLPDEATVCLLRAEGARGRDDVLGVSLAAASALVAEGLVVPCASCTVVDADWEEVEGAPADYGLTCHLAPGAAWDAVRARAAALDALDAGAA